MEELECDSLESDREPPPSRGPDGACKADNPAVSNQLTVVGLNTSDARVSSSDDGEEVDNGGKKKKGLFSCLGVARRSLRKRSQQRKSKANQSKSEAKPQLNN